MNRYILILVCVCYNCFLFAQIPCATQQPNWYFPIYAEDATGKKDTVYLGYNPGAVNSPDADVLYGEIWHDGVNDFSLYTYAWSTPTDSIIKADIRDTANYGNSLPFSVLFSNVVLPVRLKWDVSLLRSDSIPFLSQNPLPKAQIVIAMPVGNYLVYDPNVSCSFSTPIIVSDTINTNLCNCYANDSLKLLDPFGNTSPQSFYLTFEVLPWTGNSPTGLGDISDESRVMSLVPNPTNNLLTINSFDNIQKAEVITITGQIVLSETVNAKTHQLQLQNFAEGIYFVRITYPNGLSSIKKIVVNR